MTMAVLWTPRATFVALNFLFLSDLSAGIALTSSPQGNSTWPDARPALAESPDISATSQTAVRLGYLTGEVIQKAENPATLHGTAQSASASSMLGKEATTTPADNGTAYPRAVAFGKALALAIPFGIGILWSPNGIRFGIGK